MWGKGDPTLNTISPRSPGGPAITARAASAAAGPSISSGFGASHADELDDGPGAEDAALVAAGYAALTALRGPRAEDDAELLARIDRGLGDALAPFGFTG